MSKIFIAITLVLFFPFAVFAQTSRSKPAQINLKQPLTLDEKVKTELANFRGSVYIYAKNLDNGKDYDYRGGEQVRTASTIKLMIMTEVFAQVAEGKRSWNDEFVLTKEKKIGGSGVLSEFSENSKIDLKTLTNLMITVSDNTATNLILDAVTSDAVNLRMDALGLKQTRSLGKIGGGAKSKAWESTQLYKNYGIGVSSPREMVKLLELLEKGEIVSNGASKEMLGILKRQHYTDGIMRNVLDTVPTASKSGALDRLRSDVGIIYGRRGRVAMAITVDDMLEVTYSEDNPGLLLLWRLSQILQEGLAK
jgi:beta-lactamase class A